MAGTLIAGRFRQPALQVGILRIAAGQTEADGDSCGSRYRHSQDCRAPPPFARSTPRRNASAATTASIIFLQYRDGWLRARRARVELKIILVPERHLELRLRGTMALAMFWIR